MGNKKIWLSSPHMGGAELDYIQDAFNDNWIAPLGPNVDGFEEDIANYLGGGNVAALSSGTAAIHLALILLGLESGDEVICQSLTFAASANPIVYQNAKPVFVDSEPSTWNIDPNLLETAIQDRIRETGEQPKAIVAVHLYGMPANMMSINSIADKYRIPVIEDAAEALGSQIDGKKCGTFSILGTLSFNGNKIITTSGGGAITSSNKELIEKARFLATQARDEAPHYEHSTIGYNYRMSNISAGIGRGQMEVLGERIRQKREIYSQYKTELEPLGIEFLEEPDGYFSNRWLTTVIIDPEKTNGATREDIRKTLEEDNIEARPLWQPMHLQPLYQGYDYIMHNDEDVSGRLFEQGLCLPSGSNLSTVDQDRIIGIITDRLTNQL